MCARTCAPEPQPEAAPARLGQLPRRGRRHHRAAREGHRDARSARRCRPPPTQRAAGEVGRAPRLGHDQAGQPGRRAARRPSAAARRSGCAGSMASNFSAPDGPRRAVTRRQRSAAARGRPAAPAPSRSTTGSTPRVWSTRARPWRSGTPSRRGYRSTRCRSSSASGGCRRPAGRPASISTGSDGDMSWSMISK